MDGKIEDGTESEQTDNSLKMGEMSGNSPCQGILPDSGGSPPRTKTLIT